MKIKLQGVRRVKIDGDFIRLDKLLKLACITSTGGAAKVIVQNGEVFVDGERCTMRGKKIRPGSVISYGKEVLVVGAPLPGSPRNAEDHAACNGCDE